MVRIFILSANGLNCHFVSAPYFPEPMMSIFASYYGIESTGDTNAAESDKEKPTDNIDDGFFDSGTYVKVRPYCGYQLQPPQNIVRFQTGYNWRRITHNCLLLIDFACDRVDFQPCR